MTGETAVQFGVSIDAAAAAAMELMKQQGVEPTPAHYEVCFQHVSGVQPDLSCEVNRQIAAKTFNSASCAEMYARHFAKSAPSAQQLEASESIARELSGVVAALRDGGEYSSQYAHVLSEAATAFDGQLEPQGLRVMVNGLAQATREMVRRNGELAQKVVASGQQVDALQSALRDVNIKACTDGLTGLANRRAFDEALARRVAESASELCLLICDIDHFKRFNDKWGHLVGDQVIRFIAHVLQQHAGGEFLAARYGGEEFAIIMPRTGMHRAQAIAGAIRQAVKSKTLTRKSTGDVIGGVTLSIGVARRRSGEDATAVISRADRCLYASKQAGRDQVTIDADLPSQSAA